MSGMETIKGKFQGLIDVLMPWEDVEVEDSKEAAGEKKQQQVLARQSHAAAQEYKVSGGDSIYVERTEAQEPAPSLRTRARVQHPQLTVHTTKIPELRVQIYVPENFDQVTDIADNLKAGKAAVVNYERVAAEEQRRICDFVNGACYIVNGCAKRISEQIVLYAPEGVDVAEAMPAELKD